MQRLAPKIKDLGGFTIKRFVPQVGHKHIGPWVFFDHAGPASFDAGNGVDVRPHPHIGLATVTYLFEGELIHRDSLGVVQPIRPGALNIMIAGKGVTHSERTNEEYRTHPHMLHALQLWCALPNDYEDCEPSFSHHAADDIPAYQTEGVKARILMGEAHGKRSPANAYADALYVEYRVEAGHTVTLPFAEERAVYMIQGSGSVNNEIVQQETLLVLGENEVSVTAEDNSHFVLIGGTSVGTRHIDWNFVASEKTLIENAKMRWKEGGFPNVPDDDEFITLPE